MSIINIYELRFVDADASPIWITCRQLCSTKTTSSSSSKSEDNYEDNIKKKILEASLEHVKVHGWSKDALAEGAKSVGYPGISHGMFARGGAELVNFFQTVSNQNLVKFLKAVRLPALGIIHYIHNCTLLQNESKLSTITPPQFVEEAVQHRLLMIVPYLNKWPQALAVMSLPPNVPTSLASLLTMVDDICYYAGDRSVDVRFF